jgi:hypothetical protein
MPHRWMRRRNIEHPAHDADFAKLYPSLSLKELKEAGENFRRHLEIAAEVAQEANENHATEVAARGE